MINRKTTCILLAALVACVSPLVYGIQTPSTLSIPYVEKSKVAVDGTIASGEYQGLFLDIKTNITVCWEHDGTNLKIGITSPGTGWVGIGFGSKGVEMDDANMILGYVDSTGGLVLSDEIGVGRRHYPDLSRGGKDDILAKAGTQKDGKTVIEFITPLSSGDQLDHSFRPGSMYGFFLAYHATAKDSSSHHTARSDSLDLHIQPISGTTQPSVVTDLSWYYLLVGLTAVVALVLLVRFIRRPKVIRFKEMGSLRSRSRLNLFEGDPESPRSRQAEACSSI
ncbi:MAG: DOMON domain-containing protein [archaeon]